MNAWYRLASGNLLVAVLMTSVAAIFLFQWMEVASPMQSVALTFLAALLMSMLFDQMHMLKARKARDPKRGALTYKSLSILPGEAVKDAYLISLATVVAETEPEAAGRILADYTRAEISFEEAESELEDRVGEIQGRKVLYGK